MTGWKIGWATGPSDLIEKVLGVKQWFSFAAGTRCSTASPPV